MTALRHAPLREAEEVDPPPPCVIALVVIVDTPMVLRSTWCTDISDDGDAVELLVGTEVIGIKVELMDLSVLMVKLSD